MNTNYFVYVLYSDKDHLFYIGFTRDVEKRLKEHNEGFTTSTKDRRPLRLIYYECHLNKEDALRRESYFKTSSGKRTLRFILRESLTDLKG